MPTVQAFDPFASRLTRRGLVCRLWGAVALPLLTPRHLAAHEARPWAAGKPVPPFALTDLGGKTWTLAGLRGRAVLLNFWATWCEPCRAELPSLEALAARHERDGLVVLAVNYQESPATIQRFLATAPCSLPMPLDRDGQAARAWTPRIFPSTVLIDRRGRPRQVVLGEIDWTGPAAQAWVQPLLERGRPG